MTDLVRRVVTRIEALPAEYQNAIAAAIEQEPVVLPRRPNH